MRSATSLNFYAIKRAYHVVLFWVAVIGKNMFCESCCGAIEVLGANLLKCMHYVHGFRKCIFTRACIASEGMVGEVVMFGKLPLMCCECDEKSWEAVLGNNV